MSARQEIETIVVGKRITKIRWSTVDDFGHKLEETSTEIEGFDLEDGSYTSVAGSGQVDITAVWLYAESGAKDDRATENRRSGADRRSSATLASDALHDTTMQAFEELTGLRRKLSLATQTLALIQGRVYVSAPHIRDMITLTLNALEDKE